MTTGRINQVTIPTLGYNQMAENQSDRKSHAPNVQNLPSGRSSPDNASYFSTIHITEKSPKLYGPTRINPLSLAQINKSNAGSRERASAGHLLLFPWDSQPWVQDLPVN